MALTKADLRNAVMTRMGVLAAGETANAADAALVDQAIEDVHESLIQKGLADWVTSAIPNVMKRPLIALVKYEVADDFSIPEARIGRWAVEARGMFGDIRALMSETQKGVPTKAEYF